MIGCVPVVYVTDVSRSMAFYELLGLTGQERGQDGEWRWAYLKAGDVGILLAASNSVLSVDPGPIVLYLRTDDLDAVATRLSDGGADVARMGYPAHAPGGELKIVDPDGHGVMIGQVTGTPPPEAASAERGDTTSPEERSSILARAAAAARARGMSPRPCQFPIAGDRPCQQPAELKLADSCGDSVWTCLRHAEDIMINANGAFIAAQDTDGLLAYLRSQNDRSA
jgi:predicted enzyme related to lactoylglutathione lyase